MARNTQPMLLLSISPWELDPVVGELERRAIDGDLPSGIRAVRIAAQPCTQPPSPNMMLGPAVSSLVETGA